MPGWGAISDCSAHRAATPGALVVLAVVALLLVGTRPADAHQDCAPAVRADIHNKNSHCAVLCKQVVRPVRTMILRAGDTDQPSALPAPFWPTLALPALVGLPVVPLAESDVRATGVMLVGNIVLLN